MYSGPAFIHLFSHSINISSALSSSEAEIGLGLENGGKAKDCGLLPSWRLRLSCRTDNPGCSVLRIEQVSLGSFPLVPSGRVPHPQSSFSFVQFSHSVVSNWLRPHGLQHARLPCPSLSPRVCSDSCPLSQ